MPSFRYRLIDTEGSDLGPFGSSYRDWVPGGLILRVAGNLRIHAVVEPETKEPFLAYLVVEPFDVRL